MRRLARSAACLIALALGSAPAGAQLAVPTPDPATEVASTPAKSILGVRAALEGSPLECGALERAFVMLQHAGRQPGDIEVIVRARRTNVACAVQAANAAAGALAIPDKEVVAWVLANPDARPLGDASVLQLDAPVEEEMGQALDCGLLLIARSLEHHPSGSRVFLTFRNKTTREINGHDIVVRVNGQPWRSMVLPRGEMPPVSPLGAADQLHWDASLASWQDRREYESRSISWPKKETFRPLEGPVAPAGTFDIVARVQGLSAEAKATDLEITFDSCVLR